MQFKCRTNTGHKFDLEKPKEIEGNWHWKDVVHCPYCGSADLEEILVVPLSTKTTDLGVLRSQNREQTMLAQRMAAEARAADARANPEVTLAPVQNPSRFAGDVKIKKNVLESIETKRPLDYG